MFKIMAYLKEIKLKWREFQAIRIRKAIRNYDPDKHWRRASGFHISEELIDSLSGRRDTDRVPYPDRTQRVFKEVKQLTK